jgi:hypothetical protein
MRIVPLSKLARLSAAAAIAITCAYTPLQAQSENAACLRSATATCSVSTAGYASYSECVSRERQDCLSGFPPNPGPDRPPCEVNDFSCGL